MRWWVWLGMLVLAFSTGCRSQPVERVNTATPTTSPTAVLWLTPMAVPGVPEDVPIIIGAYDLQVSASGQLVTYRVKALLGEVLHFYQEVLPRYGWERSRAEDSVVGYAATLTRVKPTTARMIVSMRYDVRGGFVKVAISVARH